VKGTLETGVAPGNAGDCVGLEGSGCRSAMAGLSTLEMPLV
jgi:hypothetical protein